MVFFFFVSNKTENSGRNLNNDNNDIHEIADDDSVGNYKKRSGLMIIMLLRLMIGVMTVVMIMSRELK